MKRAARVFVALTAGLMFLGTAASAADYGTSATSAPAWKGDGSLKEEIVGIQPQVGVVVYKDNLGDNAARAVEGLTLDINVIEPFARELGDRSFQTWFAGLTIGALYSHVGTGSSNFFGTNPDVSSNTEAGANFLLLPANFKLGWNAGKGRLSVHGGGNVIYRSVASSVNTGSSSTGGSDIWRIYPNAGVDVEWGFAPYLSLMLRPDYTFTPENGIFTGTLALGILLG